MFRVTIVVSAPKTITRWRTFKLRVECAEEISKLYEEHKQELAKQGVYTFNGFINHLLWQVIEADKILRSRAPYMSLVGFTDNGVVIEDKKLGRIVEVRAAPGGDLVCELDQRNDCAHVGFAYAIPEVYSAMLARGKRPPKVWE
jgi:hypothetical protein